MSVVLEELPAPDLGQAVANVARGEVLLVGMHIALGSPVVLDHLEGRLQVSVIEATGHVGKFQNQCLVTLVLAHQLAVARLLVEQFTLLLERSVGSTALDRQLSPRAPLLNQALHSVGALSLEQVLRRDSLVLEPAVHISPSFQVFLLL